jgi:hypothetical protein
MGRQATIHSKTARVIALLDAVAAWRLLRVPATDGTTQIRVPLSGGYLI